MATTPTPTKTGNVCKRKIRMVGCKKTNLEILFELQNCGLYLWILKYSIYENRTPLFLKNGHKISKKEWIFLKNKGNLN